MASLLSIRWLLIVKVTNFILILYSSVTFNADKQQSEVHIVAAALH